MRIAAEGAPLSEQADWLPELGRVELPAHLVDDISIAERGWQEAAVRGVKVLP